MANTRTDAESISADNGPLQRGSRPVPDPTLLTTQQLLRENLWLRELIEARLDGMDKAVLILQSVVNRSPTVGEVVAEMKEKFNTADQARLGIAKHVDVSQVQLAALLDEKISAIKTNFIEKIDGMQTGVDEKFVSIATQFRERDTRTEQTSKDSKVAVDAALQAAKEAVGEQNKSNALSISKSEATFTKQIDQIGMIINTTSKNVDDKIDDLKARIGAMEARGSAYSQGFGYIATGVGIVGAIIGAVIAVFFKSGGAQ